MPSAFSVTVLQMNKRTLLLLFSILAARMKLSVTANYPLDVVYAILCERQQACRRPDTMAATAEAKHVTEILE